MSNNEEDGVQKNTNREGNRINNMYLLQGSLAVVAPSQIHHQTEEGNNMNNRINDENK